MPTETEPHLRAVSSEDAQPPASPEETVAGAESSAADSTPERKTPLWAWVVAAALVFCAVGWYTAYQGGVELRSELAATQAALAETQADLTAHQAHLENVRAQTDALATRIGTLAADAEALATSAAESPTR